MLVIVLSAMGATRMVLMLLVAVSVVLVILVVLERQTQPLGHAVCLVTAWPPIHHDIMAVLPVALIEHAELLRRLPSWRSRGRGCVGVIEGYAGASGCRRSHSTGEVAYVLWIEGLAGSPLVDRVLGHLREQRRKRRVSEAAAGA